VKRLKSIEAVSMMDLHGLWGNGGLLLTKTSSKLPARLLFVDDDALLRRAFSRSVSVLGVTLDMAESAEQALGLVSRQSYAVMVTDYQLPGLDGLELIARVHLLDPTVVSLLISGKGGDLLSELSDGAPEPFAVLAKPWRLDQLTDTLKKALLEHERRQLSAPSLTALTQRVVG
jgi:two-component system C4-dicarboxylate transport response regulator DctD